MLSFIRDRALASPESYLLPTASPSRFVPCGAFRYRKTSSAHVRHRHRAAAPSPGSFLPNGSNRLKRGCYGQQRGSSYQARAAVTPHEPLLKAALKNDLKREGRCWEADGNTKSEWSYPPAGLLFLFRAGRSGSSPQVRPTDNSLRMELNRAQIPPNPPPRKPSEKNYEDSALIT